MTRRERMERRLEKRREWAASRQTKEEAARAEYERVGSQWEFGQPILVGHHSERRHRRDIDRVWSKLGETVEHSRMADRHLEVADTLESRLETTVFSDDADAVERLTEQIAELEAKRDRMKAENAAYRRAHSAELKTMTAYERSCAVPHASYSLTNLGARIRDKQKRAKLIARDQADAAAGVRRGGRQMDSRYGGTCPDCGQDFAKGDPILWYRSTREATHVTCPEAA